MNKSTCTVGWYNMAKKPCLKFKFIGKLDVKSAEKAISDWRRFFSEKQDEKISIIWDAVEMTGYESQVQKMWQQELSRCKNQTGRVWLITESSMIKIGAYLISAFTSLDLKIVKSMNEIDV